MDRKIRPEGHCLASQGLPNLYPIVKASIFYLVCKKYMYMFLLCSCLVIQVGFFKKNPMKRSAAVYLLCVCLAVSISRKWTLTDEHAIF